MFVQSLDLWAQSIKKLVQSPNVFSWSIDKCGQLAEGVEGEWNGVNTDNVRRLLMWNNQKMKPMTFIHNDDANASTWLYKGHINL